MDAKWSQIYGDVIIYQSDLTSYTTIPFTNIPHFVIPHHTLPTPLHRYPPNSVTTWRNMICFDLMRNQIAKISILDGMCVDDSTYNWTWLGNVTFRCIWRIEIEHSSIVSSLRVYRVLYEAYQLRYHDVKIWDDRMLLVWHCDFIQILSDTWLSIPLIWHHLTKQCGHDVCD